MRRLFTFASALWPLLAITPATFMVAPMGCGAPAGENRAPTVRPLGPADRAMVQRTEAALAEVWPQTQAVPDVTLSVQGLGRAGTSMLAPGELCRMRGGGLDVVCLENHAAFLRVAEGVMLPLVSAEQMRRRERIPRLMLEAVAPPQGNMDQVMVDKGIDVVSQAMAESELVSFPLGCLPDRLTKAIEAGGRDRDRYAAIARALVASESVRLIGQLRAQSGLEAWKVDLSLTEHGRRKLQDGIARPSVSQPATMSSARFAYPTGAADRK